MLWEKYNLFHVATYVIEKKTVSGFKCILAHIIPWLKSKSCSLLEKGGQGIKFLYRNRNATLHSNAGIGPLNREYLSTPNMKWDKHLKAYTSFLFQWRIMEDFIIYTFHHSIKNAILSFVLTQFVYKYKLSIMKTLLQ